MRNRFFFPANDLYGRPGTRPVVLADNHFLGAVHTYIKEVTQSVVCALLHLTHTPRATVALSVAAITNPVS